MTTQPRPQAPREASSNDDSHVPLKASVVIVSYNNIGDIERCLSSVTAQSYSNYEVLLLDNGSSDGTPEFVQEHFKMVKVIRTGKNLGYAGGNNAGFERSSGQYLAVLNPDTEVDRDWLRELIAAIEKHPEAGLATSQICLVEDNNRINTCGNEVNFTGLAFCRGLGQRRDTFREMEEVPAVSGCAFVIRRSVLEDIGEFDDDFFMYLEDTDLSLRARLAGYRCLYVPTSLAYHDYSFNMTPFKFYQLERNRHILLLKNFRLRTLLLMAPALALVELMTLGYGLLKGAQYLSAKLRAYGWVLSHLKDILLKRSLVQKNRRVSDRHILRTMSYRIPFDRLTPFRGLDSLLKIALEPLFRGVKLSLVSFVRW